MSKLIIENYENYSISTVLNDHLRHPIVFIYKEVVLHVSCDDVRIGTSFYLCV